jgi:tetratricopeptide (TPR) repeat protein
MNARSKQHASSYRYILIGLACVLVACLPPNPLLAQSGPSPANDNVEIHLARGHEALKNNRMREAEKQFRAALALNPRLTLRARFPLAVTLFNLQDREEARKQFQLIRAQTGDDPDLSYYLGRLDLMDGKLDSAIRNLTIAVSNPPFPDAPYYLGYAYLRKGDAASAEKWLKKAAELSPRDSRVQLRLGNTYRAMGRIAQSEKAFARSAELHRQDVTATEQALECGRDLQTLPLAQARLACEKLFDPEDMGKLVSLGVLYGQHGDYVDAVAPFGAAVELNPDSYENQYNLGLTYFRLRLYREARLPLEKAVALRPDVFEVNAPLGATLYALKDDRVPRSRPRESPESRQCRREAAAVQCVPDSRLQEPGPAAYRRGTQLPASGSRLTA